MSSLLENNKENIFLNFSNMFQKKILTLQWNINIVQQTFFLNPPTQNIKISAGSHDLEDEIQRLLAKKFIAQAEDFRISRKPIA
jgi:hypothetical protein